MKVDRALRERLAAIKAFPNISVDRIERGKHFKIYLDTPSGKRMLLVSVSPSCQRAWKNNEALLRQWSQP